MNKKLQKKLEELYRKYNRREFVHPDPLEFLYNYKKMGDREIVGLIASSLAYGQVKQILKSVSLVLKIVGDSPYSYLLKSEKRKIISDFSSFKHRFATGKDVANLLIGVKKVLEDHGSLESLFRSSQSEKSKVLGLEKFVAGIKGNLKTNLLPEPEKGSACKRLNLYLRWMIRKDEVDPGGWNTIDKKSLIVPLDIHMHRISKILGLTKRNQGNLKTAVEITEAFKVFSPDDPVKYDFCLTRLGIRDETDYSELAVCLVS